VIANTRDKITQWYRQSRRDLPWRRRPTPYRVWVSEVMLQQTRVNVVVPHYSKFLRRFPSMRALAISSVEDVLEEWSGLGYYRRARLLHEGARKVMERYRGRFPREIREAMRIPGVGRYTAGAILSIAYGVRVPVLDGNVARVLSRVFGITGDVSSGEERAKLWSLAGRAVEEGDPGEINQAQMELGALVCLPRNPRCDECPLETICIARRRSWVHRIPQMPAKREGRQVRCAVLLIRSGDRILLRRRGEHELLYGMWDLPGAFSGLNGDRSHGWRKAARSVPIPIEIGVRLGIIRHVVTYRKITLEVYEAATVDPGKRVGRGRSRAAKTGKERRGVQTDDEWRWCAVHEAMAMALSAPARKILSHWGGTSRSAISRSKPRATALRLTL
jgi:A/G-specific adenine glycosylase